MPQDEGLPWRTLTIQHFVPFLHARDAVGNHTLVTDQTIREAGLRTNLWVAHVEASLARRTRPYHRFRGDGRGAATDVLLYQASTGARDMVRFLLARREPLAIYFHNITPPAFFDAYDAAAAQSMREAEQDIERLAERCTIALVASEFSASHLRPLGFRDIRLMPPYVASGNSAVPTDMDYLRSLRATHGQLDLLFVGRVVPHKGYLNLLRTLSALRSGGVDARLFMVGAYGPAPFMQALFRLRRRLGLESTAILTGSVTDGELAAHYESADIYLSLSEHEGFGIPLLEAMRTGVPVVAYRGGAVGEVLEDSGVLLGTLDPYLVAETVARIGLAPDLRQALVTRQRERAVAIDAAPRDTILLEALCELATRTAA